MDQERRDFLQDSARLGGFALASAAPSGCGAPPETHYHSGTRKIAARGGNLEEFHAGRAGEETEGHGYLSDAAEAKRLEWRGYLIVRAGRAA